MDFCSYKLVGLSPGEAYEVRVSYPATVGGQMLVNLSHKYVSLKNFFPQTPESDDHGSGGELSAMDFSVHDGTDQCVTN